MGKAKQCFVYNTKIIETPTTKEVYFYETPIYSHSNSDSKTSNTQAHKRKVFDEMSAHKQYDSLKRKQKHYEQTRWEIARIVDCNFDNKTKFLTLTFRENIQDITITNKEFKYFIQRLNYYLYQTKVQTLKYIATWEKQKRGAIHYHVIFFDFPFVAKEKLQDLWTYGFIKINRIDVDSIMSRADSIKILYQELKTGILSLTDIQEQVDMNKKQVLDLHKKMYNYWQGKNGKWYSYLPKEGVEPPKGKQIESVNEEKLNSKIIEYYVIEESRKKQEKTCPTFLEVYYMWRSIKDLELDDNSIYKFNTDCKRFFVGTDFAEMPINQINENTIKVFMLETIKRLELCKETTRKFFSYIKNVIRYARIEKIITDNPVEFLEPKDFTKHCGEIEVSDCDKYYTDTELAIILKALHGYYRENPLYMPPYAIELAMYTGMRVSELSTLKWSDINDICISINKSAKHNRLKNEFSVGKTKTKKSRAYPVDGQINHLLARIKRVQEEHGILCEWIFTDGNGSYTHARNITDCMTRLCRENKLNGGGITKLRKTTSSDLQAKGTPKSVVASMLGHTTEVNEKYYTYDTSNLAEKKKIIQERNAKFKNLAHTG